MTDLKQKLNSRDKNERLDALRAIKAAETKKTDSAGITNNHVHSTYSFSPYAPARIAYEADQNGLDIVGIMDHDSISGAKEFIEAGKIIGITTTVGFEIRTDWSDTPFKDKRINNPDQIGCAYMCVHGIPHQKIDEVVAFLTDVVAARNQRNREMVTRINGLVPDITLSFEDDVVPLSMLDDGGSITERHILFALAHKMIEKYGKGRPLVDYFKNVVGMAISAKQEAVLMDEAYEYYAYDILNLLKGSFVSQIYIPAKPPEIPPIKKLAQFCMEIGAVLGYAYLGDVTASPTGDKKAQIFEDAYLDELFDYLKELGIQAVAYMPSRNTLEQLQRVMALCKKHDFFEISGEDINQPRQSFICEQLKQPEFAHLVQAAWALVGHENEASKDITRGMFMGAQKDIPLSEKLPVFEQYGRQAKPKR